MKYLSKKCRKVKTTMFPLKCGWVEIKSEAENGNIQVRVVDETSVGNVKGVPCTDKPKDNYHPALQFRCSIERFSVSQLILLVFVGLVLILLAFLFWFNVIKLWASFPEQDAAISSKKKSSKNISNAPCQCQTEDKKTNLATSWWT